MQIVIGRVATPASSAPYPRDGLQLEHQEEQHRAERGVHDQGHHVRGAEGAVARRCPSGSIGCSLRRSTTTNPTARDQHRRPAPTARRRRPTRSARRSSPPSASAASTAPSDVELARRVGSRGLGHRRAARSRPSTTASGRLIRKIQRQTAYSTSEPPTNGPIAAAMPPSPDQAPIAGARSSRHERALDHRQAARGEQRGADALEDAGGDQHLGRRARCRTAARRRANQMVPMTKIRRRPNRSPSEPPSRIRLAQREQVAVGDPLQLGQAGVEVLADRAQRDVDDRAVEHRHARSRGRRRAPPRGRSPYRAGRRPIRRPSLTPNTLGALRDPR